MTLTAYCIPAEVNRGPWLTAYTLPRLQQVTRTTEVVLPICSLGTPFEQISKIGDLVLPPLYHEALGDGLKQPLLRQIERCFPYFELDPRREGSPPLRIVELPAREQQAPACPGIAAFSVDTAVEEHGPHLPLATDRIQSYGVLRELANEFSPLRLVQPIDYGHLTWGLPFGMSVDTTPALLTRYVAGFTNALVDWLRPKAVYVVDVHGSIVHRNAIQDGLRQSKCSDWRFRWLHDPLVAYAGDRGDQHAGGVETILVEKINPKLLDAEWFPKQREAIARRQMTLQSALELSPDLHRFVKHVAEHRLNGVVGVIENYDRLDVNVLWSEMIQTAREDVGALCSIVAG